MFDPKLAIEWLTAKQKLCLKMELPLTELVVELYEYVDQFSENDLTGLSDFLALYAELLESLDAEQLPQAETIMAEVAQQLDAVFTQPAEPFSQSLVSALQSSDWPEPVAAEDAEFLLPLLMADAHQLNPDGAVELVSVDDSASTESNTHSDELSSLLTWLQQITDQNEAIDQALLGESEELIDRLSEQNWAGFSDLLALYSELLQELDDLTDNQIANQLNQAFIQLLQQPSGTNIASVLALMTDNAWPEAIEEEDANFLNDLLQEDCQKIADTSVDSSEPESLGTDVSNEVPEELTELDISDSELDLSELDSADADFDTELLLDDIGSSETNNADLTLLLPLLEQMGAELPLFSEENTEQFYELIDRYSEDDWTGLTDLLALYGELLIQLPEIADQSIASTLNSAMVALLQKPTEPDFDGLFTLMMSDAWDEPVPSEDVEFLQPLLITDLERLSLLAKEEPVIESEPVEVEEEAAAVLPAPPVFCELDHGLLEQGNALVDPAVVMMLSQSVEQLAEQWQTDEIATTAVADTVDGLETVIRALQTINMNGAKVLVQGLITNLEYLQQHQVPVLSEQRSSVANCLNNLLSYFADLSEPEVQQDLLTAFSDNALPCQPDTEAQAYIEQLFALAAVQTSEDIVQEQANPEDVELHESSDIEPQLLEMLHTELPTLSEDYLDSIQQLLDQQHKPALRSAQRAVHTLKGLANMAGIKGLANLAHRLEDVLEFLADEDHLPSGKLGDDLLEASDCLAAMAETITAGESAPTNAQAILQRIMDWDYHLKTEGLAALEQMPDTVKETDNAISETDVVEASPEPETAAPAEAAKEESQVFRVPGTILDNLFRLAGESSTLNAQLDEEVSQLRGFTRTNRERHRNLQRVLFELEQQFNEQINLLPHLDESADDFDPLEMDRYNEMHTTISRVQEAVADVREVTLEMEGHIHNLNSLHISQSSLQKETFENVLSTRQVEVGTITSRLQRILRQVCRSTGKDVQLIIQGEDTLVDSNILNQLADPLLHIIRNAVDHGIESANLRQQRGKPEQGTITLSFEIKGGNIEVRCQDDGGGINTQRVLAAAQEKQLIDPEQPLSTDDVHRLILLPGFSTSEAINQLSGRGIGMDVVHQQILRLQGTVNIQSKSEEGTVLNLSIPASSLLFRALLVRSGKQIFALAGHGIEQSLISLDGAFQREDDQLFFNHEDECYPVFMLEELLNQRRYDYTSVGAVHPLLVVNLAQGEKVAVLVNEIIAHRELAMKQMGNFVPDLPGIPGVTILANGETAPIVDLPNRIRHQRTALIDQPELVERDIELELPRVLVVDDSLSARKSLETLLSDTGYDVMTAIDGLDALNQVRKHAPDLIVTDMEMPRMGGVELTSLLKNREETAHLPVVMITSRSTDKHRSEALEAGVDLYLTKPWSESQLLDQVEGLLAQVCA